jgi:hypothetical protein
MAKSPAWQRKEGKNPKGGLNAKTAKDPDSRINKSLRAWKC